MNKSFYIFRNGQSQVPTILTENGFYPNKEQCKAMMQQKIMEMIAECHVEAIKYIEAYGLEGTTPYPFESRIVH